MEYQVHYEPGNFNGQAGATKLAEAIDRHCGDGRMELVAIVPAFIREGRTTAVQIVLRAVVEKPPKGEPPPSKELKARLPLKRPTIKKSRN